MGSAQTFRPGLRVLVCGIVGEIGERRERERESEREKERERRKRERGK